jgi:hypothetical protein
MGSTFLITAVGVHAPNAEGHGLLRMCMMICAGVRMVATVGLIRFAR